MAQETMMLGKSFEQGVHCVQFQRYPFLHPASSALDRGYKNKSVSVVYKDFAVSCGQSAKFTDL